MAAVLGALLISWPPPRHAYLAIIADLVLQMLCRCRHRRKQPTPASGTLFAGLVMAWIHHGFTIVWLLAWRCALPIAVAGAPSQAPLCCRCSCSNVVLVQPAAVRCTGV
ncbi:hypothetical protein Dimus_013762, partial [Dionaea muscipula]